MTSPFLLTSLVLVFVQLTTVGGFIVLSWGKCPDIPSMDNFNIQRYMGKWYATESFDAPYQFMSYCISANYTLLPGGDAVRVYNSGKRGWKIGNRLLFAEDSVADGFATVRNPLVPSALNVEFPAQNSGFFATGPRSKPNYLVVTSDYDNYALVWSCVETSVFLRVDTAWILSRTKQPPANTNELKSILTSYGINTRFFKKIDQDIC
ncbi:apolipoprotein D [Aplysia californica]|uniref:Apolipoprotein D n=1 Tax=Aplysia californica TaxID=6500 RepID=A0ABM1AA28_APLCA|nr:apolipoprotein D [Aplysia californica]XP_012943720.1 apolipoprotein D [Aplysia californica]XP_012943721.1 apolipoprotein D [Aplysia californica]